jgi:hypothetical protein
MSTTTPACSARSALVASRTLGLPLRHEREAADRPAASGEMDENEQ